MLRLPPRPTHPSLFPPSYPAGSLGLPLTWLGPHKPWPASYPMMPFPKITFPKENRPTCCASFLNRSSTVPSPKWAPFWNWLQFLCSGNGICSRTAQSSLYASQRVLGWHKGIWNHLWEREMPQPPIGKWRLRHMKNHGRNWVCLVYQREGLNVLHSIPQPDLYILDELCHNHSLHKLHT